MKKLLSTGLLAALIGTMICSSMANACDKKGAGADKGAATKGKQPDKPKQESDASSTAPKADEKTATTK